MGVDVGVTWVATWVWAEDGVGVGVGLIVSGSNASSAATGALCGRSVLMPTIYKQ